MSFMLSCVMGRRVGGFICILHSHLTHLQLIYDADARLVLVQPLHAVPHVAFG